MSVLEQYVDAGGRPGPAQAPGVVSARNLSKRYGQGDAHVDALRGVSLEIEEARMTAVMGPSGSGKSTLMHILAGLDQPTGGAVSIARALLPRPTVLFADEPTGNLDSNTSRDVLGLLRNSVDELGQTIVMVTHDPQAAAQADRSCSSQTGSSSRRFGPRRLPRCSRRCWK